MNHVLKRVLLCVLVAIVVFFGAQLITGTGIFKKPGEVLYDESLSSEEIVFLGSIFNEEIVLDKDVTISARNELSLPELSENEYLYNVSVATTDFYNTKNNIDVESVDMLFDSCSECGYKIIDVNELEFDTKLLKINNNYYLDDYKSGAIFRIISFDSEKFDEEIKPLINDSLAKKYPSQESVMTFAQTGVTAFSRLMNAKMNEVDSGEYFAAGLADFLSKYDYTHTSSEASFSGWAPTSGSTGTPICADWRFVDTLKAISLDIIELTGNHNQDCGYDAAWESIDFYKENNIMIVGGGGNATEAAVPLQFGNNNTHITMLAYNLSTGGATYGDAPGANQYYEDEAAVQIAEAKARGDYVIVDIQYYECSAYVADYEDSTCDYADSAPGDQIGFFRHLIDLGVDVVVGTSAHQPQTFELYNNGAIYYGLGNLFFDQYKWPGTTRSLILVHHFYNGKLLQTEVVPTKYDANFQPTIMEDSEWFINRLISERP